MARPTDAPKRWAYDGTADKVDAAAAFAEIGFVDNDPARNDWLNWAMYTYGEWLRYIKRGGEIIPIPPATAAIVDATGGTVTRLIGGGPGFRIVAGATVPGSAVAVFPTVFTAGDADKVSVHVDNITASGTVSISWGLYDSTVVNTASPARCSTASRNYTAADDDTTVDQTFTVGTTALSGPSYLVAVINFTAASDAIDINVVKLHVD